MSSQGDVITTNDELSSLIPEVSKHTAVGHVGHY